MKKVYMYSLSNCIWCRKTKLFFSEHQVPYTFIDYDLADVETQKSISREIDEAGVSGFPFVNINGEVIVGYKPENYIQALGI